MSWSLLGHKCNVPSAGANWICPICGDHWVRAGSRAESNAAGLLGEDVRTSAGGIKRPPLF